MKSIEITANSYAEALKEALEQLGLSENEVDAEKVKETGLLRKKVTPMPPMRLPKLLPPIMISSKREPKTTSIQTTTMPSKG